MSQPSLPPLDPRPHTRMRVLERQPVGRYRSYSRGKRRGDLKSGWRQRPAATQRLGATSAKATPCGSSACAIRQPQETSCGRDAPAVMRPLSTPAPSARDWPRPEVCRVRQATGQCSGTGRAASPLGASSSPSTPAENPQSLDVRTLGGIGSRDVRRAPWRNAEDWGPSLPATRGRGRPACTSPLRYVRSRMSHRRPPMLVVP